MKAAAVEVPPPGPGLKTDRLAVAGTVKSVARIVALNCVLLTKTVLRLCPFHKTVELLMKLDPVTPRLKPGLPATALDGEITAREGTGLGGGGGV